MPKPKHKVLGKATRLTLTAEQAALARDFGTIKKTTGGYQTTFAEIASSISENGGVPIATVYDTVLSKIKDYAGRPDDGSYQVWCREVLTANGITWV